MQSSDDALLDIALLNRVVAGDHSALGMSDFAPGFFIDVSDYADLKHRMMRCHKTQLVRGKEGDFGKLEEIMRRQYESRGAQAGVAAAEAFRIHRAFKRARAW